MNEYASRFFVLLQRGIEIENEKKQWTLTASAWPYISDRVVKRNIMQSIDNTERVKPDKMKIDKDRKNLRKLFRRKK